VELTAGVPPLHTFYVYLTSGCNCACRHCWIVPASSGAGIFLDPALLRTAIEEALPLGLQALKWTGGEPTLHPRFPELLALQQEYRLVGRLESNGMLIDAGLAELLRETGTQSISVSLDGAQAATHDTIRGVTGGFARTCAGIRALVGAGYRPELILTLQRANVAELPDYLDLAAELGAGSVKLNVLQPLLRGAELAVHGAALDVLEILELAGLLQERALSADGVPVTLDVPLAFRPLGALLDGEGGGVCDISHILGLLPTGAYALCGIGSHVAELVMGVAGTDALAAVWCRHPLLTELRRGLPEQLQGICGECLMKAACRGSCVAANYQTSGDLFAAHWFCRRAAELGAFPSTRRVPCLSGNDPL